MKIYTCILIWNTVTILKSIGAVPSSSLGEVAQKALFQDPQVYITVSPEAGYRQEGAKVILLDRMLELHWENFKYLSGDSIGLFNSKPSETYVSSAVLEQHQITSGSGSVKTNVRYARIPLNATMNKCLGFWIAYLRKDNNKTKVIMSNCLSIHPTWMNEMRDEIGNVPLSSLMIPGTHDAGSWIYYEGPSSETAYNEYTYCQEDSIYDQLINGIRSLDVRVGFYPGEEDHFYVNHDVIQIRPLKLLLEDVRRFVLETNELVFLDFHQFPVGFDGPDSQYVHRLLVTFILSKLRDVLVPKSVTLSGTPRQIWDSERNVVIFYSDAQTTSNFSVLWPGVYQAWANTEELDQLETYLESAIKNQSCKGKAWSLMAQLTSAVADAILKPTFGVRGYSNVANNPVSKWFQRESWYSKSMIVALDYYLGTNVVETAISVNKNRKNVC